MKRIVIIGATSSIAEHCARLWVKEPIDLTLVGRNQDKLDLIARDLEVRSPHSKISIKVADFGNPYEITRNVSELSALPIDIALIAHGSLPEQTECENDLHRCNETLTVNGISPVLFAEALIKHMETRDSGTLAIISSVAGDRGRKSNYIYGAAKGLVTRYAQGLQHRLANTGVSVVLIKPGPTDTPMTAGLKATGAVMTPPETVAMNIVHGVEKCRTTVYAPKKWALIMMIVRHIPSSIFAKLNI